MGFEVYYHFSEKLDGDYNRGESKTFKKRIGDPFDDIPLEKLASSITAQLARRDIFITDVEVYELSKKKISFKEAKGGIVIRNKKFLFDSTEVIISSTEDEGSEEQQYADDEEIPAPSSSLEKKPVHPHESLRETKPRRPIDLVVFAPEPQQLPELKKKNLEFTIDKKYEVFEKRPSPTGIGELYVLKDDREREQVVSDLYFIPGSTNLFGDKELGFSCSSSRGAEPNLLWGNAIMDQSMPNVRRK